MTREHWKIFIQHARAVHRLADGIDRAYERGLVTKRRGESLIRATEVHEENLERLIAQIEKANVK